MQPPSSAAQTAGPSPLAKSSSLGGSSSGGVSTGSSSGAGMSSGEEVSTPSQGESGMASNSSQQSDIGVHSSAAKDASSSARPPSLAAAPSTSIAAPKSAATAPKHTIASDPTLNSPHPSPYPSSPSSPRFQITSSIASPISNASLADAQSGQSTTVARKSAGAWRAPRMHQGQQTASNSGSNSPLKHTTSDLHPHTGEFEPRQPRLTTQAAEGDMWEPWYVGQNTIHAPPGAVSELPSMSSRSPLSPTTDTEPPWVASHTRGPSGLEYDWASFVYAYSRGKWDPTRLPQPPAHSNVFPGVEMRIGTRNEETFRPLSPELSPDHDYGSGRRPSIDYLNPASGQIHRQLSDPDRRSSVTNSLASPPTTKLRQRVVEAPSNNASSIDQVMTSTRQAAEEPSTSTKLVDPFHLLQVASSSAPQVGQAEALGDFAQRLIDTEVSRRTSSSVTGGNVGSKTDSELTTRAHLDRLPSDPAGTNRRNSNDPNSLASPKSIRASASDSPPSRKMNAVASLRPALTAQMSELTLNAGYTSRGKDILFEGTSSSGASSPPSNTTTRPQPTPMQALSDEGEEEAASSALPEKGQDNLVALTQGEERRLEEIMEPLSREQRSQHKEEERQIPLGESDFSGLSTLPEVCMPTSSINNPFTPFSRPDAGDAEARWEPDSHRRASHSVLPEVPVLLSRVGQSNSSPSLSTYIGLGRRVETFYHDNGYLPAMMPPDENERRQALRRYGPPRLRGDSNFERIAHLVKLVFNSKLVLISLVGEKTQFFQTEVGAKAFGFQSEWLQQIASARDCSMCGHAILQPTDEPLVVLDTQRDWRFAGNPLVVGEPKIRFYAGSPLRTSDGFNLGSLCIIDDTPWPEFSPRQRHTLREFARVAMREMELIRDTIHLRTQDRMQHSIELFTRKCIEMESSEAEDDKDHSQGLHQVYALAAKSMVDALQATGAVIFDLSHFELVIPPQHHMDLRQPGEASPEENAYSTLETSARAASQIPDPATHGSSHVLPSELAISTSSSPYLANQAKLGTEEKLLPPMAVLGACESLPPPPTRGDNVPASHYARIADFLHRHRTGSFFSYTPFPLRLLLPSGMSNVFLVPIFGLNRQPFALLCAYSRQSEDGSTMEDIKESGLQYLRAKGTIILSAILKKDIMLADKAKSHFISNISHELRTPLHGILAAAELLAETKLNSTQGSYLETVEACGKSLLELVNHVLDFTKLSGNLHAKQAAVKPAQQCDLVKLVQEVCESSWIGQMAKNLESQHNAGIGSVYAKGSEASSTRSSAELDGKDEKAGMSDLLSNVETVIDVSMRPDGWLVNTDAGGIRRVLMNLIGNSLKFTSNGFVHVSLREIQSTESHVLVELGVTDTGKGISKSFLEEQLFHPFTQENHLGPGTGLGLSIVNSIVQSPAINGKIDVWSTVGQGTEIRVTCELEISNQKQAEGPIYRPVLNVEHQRSIAFLGFDESKRGQSDLKDVLRSYYEDWWRFKFEDDIDNSDLILINDDYKLVRKVVKARSASRLPPIILLISARGSSVVNAVCEEYQAQGGVVRLLFKPAGPAKLEAVTDFCLQCFERGRAGLPMVDGESAHSTPLPSPSAADHLNDARKDYFSSVNADPNAEDEAETPRGNPPTEGGLKLPSIRPKLSDDLRKTSYHISPGPPSQSDAVLLRRHSSEDRTGKKQRQNRVNKIDEGHTEGKSGGNDVQSDAAHLRSGEKSSRPLMPTRSITYHEPRLQRHVLMSPLRSPQIRRSHDGITGEAMDYFGPGAASVPSGASSSFGSSLDNSSPSSPGSVISLDGGEGAVLRSAIHNAGLVRHGAIANTGQTTPAHYKKRLQILSVEDNSINRRVLAAFFGKMDVDLVEATNGEEGVRAFESYPPFHFDVIFMDLSMPVLDGIGAIMQIRKIEADRFRAEQSNTMAWIKATRRTADNGAATSTTTHRPPPASPSSAAALLSTPGGSRPSAQARAKIFALTGRSSDDDKRRAFATGADGFIVKPLSYKVLSSLIATISAYR